MLSKLIQKLLPPKEQLFFKLFKDSMDIVLTSAKLLEDIYQNGMTEEKINQAGKLRVESRNITHHTIEKLGVTFITPLEKEDIQGVTFHLNKLSKRIITTIKNIHCYHLTEYNDSLRLLATTLVHVLEELQLALEHLKKPEITELTAITERIKELEAQIDFNIRSALSELFQKETDILLLLKLQRLYRDMETLGESCYNLADRILNIVLKNS